MTFIFYSYSPSGECSLDKIRCHPLCVCVCIIIQLVISLYMNCLITCVSCCSISMILTLNFSLYFSEPQGKNGKCSKKLLLINPFTRLISWGLDIPNLLIIMLFFVLSFSGMCIFPLAIFCYRIPHRKFFPWSFPASNPHPTLLFLLFLHYQ